MDFLLEVSVFTLIGFLGGTVCGVYLVLREQAQRTRKHRPQFYDQDARSWWPINIVGHKGV